MILSLEWQDWLHSIVLSIGALATSVLLLYALRYFLQGCWAVCVLCFVAGQETWRLLRELCGYEVAEKGVANAPEGWAEEDSSPEVQKSTNGGLLTDPIALLHEAIDLHTRAEDALYALQASLQQSVATRSPNCPPPFPLPPESPAP